MATLLYRAKKSDTKLATSLAAAGWTLTNLRTVDSDPDCQLFAKQVDDRVALEVEAAVPDAHGLESMVGVQALAPPSRVEIAEKYLREAKLSKADATHRTNYLKSVVEMSDELVKQAKLWRPLAYVAVVLVFLSLLFAGYQIHTLVAKIPADQLTGVHLIGLVFVFALFVISPGVLFLLGRPLKGMDEWTPDGLLKSDKPAEDAGKDGGKDADKGDVDGENGKTK